MDQSSPNPAINNGSQPSINSLQTQKYVPNDNVTYRPYFAYAYYILKRIIKNKSTWILTAITLIFTLFFGIIPVFFSDVKLGFNSVMMFAPLIIIVFSVVFGTIKSLNIFTDSQSDGTELIIVSKPITRTQLLITRFTFFMLLGLAYSLLVLVFWIIGLSITGFNNVSNLSTVIVGIWAASFLGYAFVGSITILIALKFSSRIARVIPLIIIGISVIISYVPTMFGPSLGGKMPTDISAKITSAVEQNYGNLPAENKFKLINPESVDKNPILVTEFKLGNQYMSNQSDYPFLSNTIIDGKMYSYIADGYIRAYASSSSLIDTFYIKNMESGVNKDAWTNIYTYIMDIAAKQVKDITVAANPMTAINFINPVSAFSAIAGTSGFSVFSMFGGSYGNPVYAYNYSYSQFKLTNTPITIAATMGPGGVVPMAITANSMVQVDSPLFVALVWFGIFVAMIGLSALIYSRKDFK